MIRKLLLSAVGALALLGTANAADMPVKRPVYKAVPAPVFNWTGFYIGGHIGYGWGSADIDGFPADPAGIFGGAQIGYNWQAPGSRWVFGIEADISASDINDTIVGPTTTTLDYFGTVRARLGYAQDRALFYITGGFAYGSNSVTAVVGTADEFHTGWAAGAGLEWAFSQRWSAKVEYLYVDLGREFYNIGAGGIVSLDFHTVKFGVNYRW
jgi:outer membrane immunogenic protein